MNLRVLVTTFIILVASILYGCGGGEKPKPNLPIVQVAADTSGWETLETHDWISVKVDHSTLRQVENLGPDSLLLVLEDKETHKLFAGFVVVRFSEVASTNDVEASTRGQLGDQAKLLKFIPCPFGLENGSCIELVDQKNWLGQSDALPIQINYFIQSGSRLYGVSLGQDATFDMTKGIGPQVLSTLKFGRE